MVPIHVSMSFTFAAIAQFARRKLKTNIKRGLRRIRILRACGLQSARLTARHIKLARKLRLHFIDLSSV